MAIMDISIELADEIQEVSAVLRTAIPVTVVELGLVGPPGPEGPQGETPSLETIDSGDY
jgi:hypothetical protein